MDQQVMNGETGETLAGAARLLERAAVLEWARSDVEGPRSALQVIALGIEVLAAETLALLPAGLDLHGPVPAGEHPAGLLRSAESLLSTLAGEPGGSGYTRLARRVRDLTREVNLHAGR